MLVDDKVEIKKDFYERIQNADREAAMEMMMGIAIRSGYNPCGYGFYSPRLSSYDGKYFFHWSHGESCD